MSTHWDAQRRWTLTGYCADRYVRESKSRGKDRHDAQEQPATFRYAGLIVANDTDPSSHRYGSWYYGAGL
jgi:hypothetical protein